MCMERPYVYGRRCRECATLYMRNWRAKKHEGQSGQENR